MSRLKHSTRDQQPFTGGLGQHFTSPVKRSNPKRVNPYVVPIGFQNKRQRLGKRLETLQAASLSGNIAESLSEIESTPSVESAVKELILEPESPTPEFPFNEFPLVETVITPSCRIVPDRASRSLYSLWNSLLPTLIDPFLAYSASMAGAVPPVPSQLDSKCTSSNCQLVSSTVLCLFHTHFSKLSVQTCECETLAEVLVSHGLFPTAPSHPRMAVSVHLLDFYHALFERSCDAVNALAAALNSFYQKRGYILLNQRGQPIRDAFRRGLGHAIQWYDNLQVRIEQKVEAAIVSADQLIQANKAGKMLVPDSAQPEHSTPEDPDCHAPLLSTPSSFGGCSPVSSSSVPMPLTHCARVLQRRCPACFGGTTFGRSFEDGGDVHVCVDGNFNHRHLKSSGDCPKFYEPEYMLPKCQVDVAGHRIEQARKKSPKARTPSVPDEAVDECESTHVAGSGSNSKTNMEKFDDGGVMALVCRHDIPLFLANIDTPGEQQKYAVALIEHLFTLLPLSATVAVLYDVGCVLDRSCQLYDILPNDITERLIYSTNAMHAYVHQWSCQLVYNPRLRQGLGLTDGEGVERLWSRLRKLIGITRSCHRARRLWMLDRQVHSIALEHRDDLGLWISRRLTKGVEGQGDVARKTLEECGISDDVLRTQWDQQRAAQLSIRAHAPARLKKELNSVLSLQGELEGVDKAITTLQAELSHSSAPEVALEHLTSLQHMQDGLKEQGEALYASLNVPDSFPELQDVDFEFVRLLLMARDLKINIRKRAIGSFLEWDRLDQAVGGREQSLGTKLHQATRKAIAKRKPALMNAIRKFNGYCAQLAALHREEWDIPLPEPLPLHLAPLRDSSLLLQDVWITRTHGELPLWLQDPKVRRGIRATLKVDRCVEERRRLGIEADNLCRWFGREVCALRVAIDLPSNASISTLLQQQYDHLVALKEKWSSPLASIVRFDSHIGFATALAIRLVPTDPKSRDQKFTWLPAVTPFDEMDLAHDESHDDLYSGVDSTITLDLQLYTPEDADTPELVDLFEEIDVANDNVEECLSSNSGCITPPRTVPIIWILPEPFYQDKTILQRLHFQTFGDFAPANLQRYFYRGDTRIYFDPSDIAIMSSPTKLLNDVCVNGLAALLQYKFSDPSSPASRYSSQCALFSTFDLLMIRYDVTDTELWQRTHKIEYWHKECWIVPIHRPVLHCIG